MLPRHRCLKPVIIATQRADIRKIIVQIQSGKVFVRLDLKKKKNPPQTQTHKNGLVEWVKV
jgi:hypothetical protein